MGSEILCDNVGGEFEEDHAQREEGLTCVDLGQSDTNVFRKIVCLGITQVRSVLRDSSDSPRLSHGRTYELKVKEHQDDTR